LTDRSDNGTAQVGTLPWWSTRAAERIAGLVSDRAYLRLRFRRHFGRWPSLIKPRSFNEHLLDYKLSFRGDPRYAELTDKIAVKEHVAKLLGVEHVIPTLWHGGQLPPREQRDWPKPYVIKAAHSSDSNLFIRTAADEDWSEVEMIVGEWLSHGYVVGRNNRETQYEHIPRRLLVEPMLGDGEQVPPDYKFWVFGGRVGLLWKDEGRYVDHKRYTFDRDWAPLPFDFYHRRGAVDPQPPRKLGEMIEFAEMLGRDFEFVDVDFYEVDGRVYFGEMTFSPAGGRGRFFPPEADYAVGQLWPQCG
jgi:hypothetical protein